MEAPLPATFHGIPATTAMPPSVGSSPRSRDNDSWDSEPRPPQPPPKLRLMCSYGGRIVPRPHDNALCYIGGDTRIIVIDRHTSLSDLNQRLSKSLLHNQSFSLKYQLPSEDLDSLISITTDEDLENMVEEYERLNNSVAGAKPGRLRLFLFSRSSSSVEQLLTETSSAKSEDWFFNHLNGNASLSASDRGFSESSSINCLLGLDDEFVGKATVISKKDAEARMETSKTDGKNGNVPVSYSVNNDAHSVPDSPLLETSSSFGSTSSSPSVANLPKVERLGIEDQFQQMTVAVNQPMQQKQECDRGFIATGVAAAAVVSGFPVGGGSEYAANRIISDDERSDHGGYRKVQQIQPQVQNQAHPQQIPQYHQKQTTAFDLPSPDSVSSEGSASNSLYRMRQDIYQENIRSSSNEVDLKLENQNNSKVQESGYMFSGQYDQNQSQLHQPQQYIHAGNQYIPAGAVPIASYYPIYPPQQQHHHHPHQPLPDQQYPFYFSATQNQPFNLPVQQPSYSEFVPNNILPPAVSPNTAYNQARNIPPSKPEMAGVVYRTAAVTQQLVQVPSNQQQAQYVGFTQIRHPSPAINSTYGYEFADTAHPQIYYTPLPPQLAAQYQSLAPTIGDASPQLTAENIKQ